MEQAATLADYEDDHDTVTALVAAAKVGEVPFARAKAHAAEARATATATAELRAALTDARVRIVDAGTRASRLDRLTDTEDVLKREEPEHFRITAKKTFGGTRSTSHAFPHAFPHAWSNSVPCYDPLRHVRFSKWQQ